VARITVEDCLKKVPSRFELVHLAAQRVRQIREGSEYLVSAPKNEDIVIALREIAAGKVTKESMSEMPESGFFDAEIEGAETISQDIIDEMAKNMDSGAEFTGDGVKEMGENIGIDDEGNE